MSYLILIDEGSGYHKLKFDKKSLYISTLAYLFGRYMYAECML